MKKAMKEKSKQRDFPQGGGVVDWKHLWKKAC